MREGRRDRGMTLIELIVGLAISSVVTLMAAQFFSAVVRLHRSSTEISALQKEALVITSQLERAVMGAEEICCYDNGSGLFLLLGRREGDELLGQVFYYDRSGGKLYTDAGFRQSLVGGMIFGTLQLQGEMKRLAAEDYLVSNKVQDLRLSLSEPLEEAEGDGAYTWRLDRRVAVTAALTMQYHESRSYQYGMTAMTRGPVGTVTWHEG